MPLSDDSVRPGLHEQSDNLTSSLLGHMWLQTACVHILRRNKLKKKLMDKECSRKKRRGGWPEPTTVDERWLMEFSTVHWALVTCHFFFGHSQA